ncbi:hypothetical protein G6F32_015610 [Rhizopus arrhizus]|nr:hypothetical protein G6F32_015610 [Rhizopus arrhizus]
MPSRSGSRAVAGTGTGAGRIQQPLLRPGRPGLRIAARMLRREVVDHCVVSRMHGQRLAEDVRGEFADDQPVSRERSGDFVAIVLAGRRRFRIEEALVPSRNLQGLETYARRPLRDGRQAVEGRHGVAELRQVQAGAFDRLHIESLIVCRSTKNRR